MIARSRLSLRRIDFTRSRDVVKQTHFNLSPQARARCSDSKKFSTAPPATSATSSTVRFSLTGYYNHCLEAYPLTTKCVSSGILLTIADCLCQKIEHAKSSAHEFSLDVKRAFRFSLMGAFFIAPATHYWYGYLNKILPFTSRSPTAKFFTTAKRVVLDQILFAPIFIPSFFATLSTLEGKSIEKTLSKVQADTFPTYLTNLGVWVPAQLINFSLVPSRYQVLFSNFVGFFWNTHLSWVGNDNQDDER